MKKFIRDSLYYDQACAEIIPRNNGKPYEFIAVDASTIRIARVDDKKEIDTSQPLYVQVIDGVVRETYDENELIFGVRNPRTDIRCNGYGFAEPEQIMTTVTSHLWAEDANRKKFSQGFISNGILVLKGDIDRDELLSFRRQWLTQMTGVINAWKNPTINIDSPDGDVKWIPLQSPGKDMEFLPWIEYLIRVMTAVYLIDPTEINFDIRGFGGGTPPLFETSNEAKQKWSKDRGLRPLLDFLASQITKKLIWPYNKDFIFEFVGLDAKTEQEAIDLRVKEGNLYKTINELRQEADLPPLENGDVISLSGYLNKMQMAQMGQAGSPEEEDIESLLGMKKKGKEEKKKPVEKEAEEEITTETGFEFRTSPAKTEWEQSKHASHSGDNLKKSKKKKKIDFDFLTFEELY